MAKQSSRTEHAILGFLSWRPMSGYDIKQAVSESVGNFWSESFGQIYPALHRMEDSGWIERVSGDLDDAGGRPKQSYGLTRRGREVLAEWLSEPPVPRKDRNELLLKVFFGTQGDLGAIIGHVGERMANVQQDLKRYASIREGLEGDKAEHADAALWRLTVRYGELERKAQLAWCREALKILRTQQDDSSQSGSVQQLGVNKESQS